MTFLHNRDISFCEILCNFTLGNILNVAKWHCGKVANVTDFVSSDWSLLIPKEPIM